MGDDWRVRIAFGVLPRGLRAFRQALIPAVGSRLGDQVTVSSGKTQVFVYAPSIALADQAAQVAGELLALHGIKARIGTEFWSLREQRCGRMRMIRPPVPRPGGRQACPGPSGTRTARKQSGKGRYRSASRSLS
jgi:hypothetical protein